MGFIVILIFFVLLMIGVPVVLAIAIPSVFYILFNGIPIEIFSQRIHYAMDSFPLLAIPVFILIGQLMNSSGITRRIFRFADILFGRVPGGLAQVNIFASLIFSGMSGAALADVGGLGQIEIQAMKEKGFTSQFSAAVTAASATIGPIFPPSIPLVIYGSVAGVSVVKLLLGGIVPALLAFVMLIVLTAVLSIIRKYPREEKWPRARQVMLAFIPAFPAILAPVLLVVLMLAGIATPTEAASITVGYILLISLLIYKGLSIKHFLNSLFETIKLSASILIIVAVASLFGWILSVEFIPQIFASKLLPVSNNPLVLLLIANIIFFITGMFLDSTTATLLLVPIIAPPLVAAGIDPIHLGLVTVFNLMLGLLTPPMGLSLFMISKIAGAPVYSVLKELLPYFIILLLTLIMITYLPEISLWIPERVVN
jgi:tripartite ATP-independent transporter DctM subunit